MTMQERCQVCGWPMAERVEDGCVPGNCSARPRPQRHVGAYPYIPPKVDPLRLTDAEMRVASMCPSGVRVCLQVLLARGLFVSGEKTPFPPANDLVKQIAALLPEWRPIDTAPKDGTPILGFMPRYYQGKGGQSVILWMDGDWYDSRAFVTTPSHWMPLPQPPEQQP